MNTETATLPTRLTRELRLTLALNRFGGHRPVLLTFRLASRLGDGLFWYALMAAILLVEGRAGLPIVTHMAAVGLFVATLYRAMKNVIRRPRPCHRHTAIVARVRPLDEFSFPSGHTLHAVCFSVVASSYLPALAWLLIPVTALIAASRVVLGVHYPSDVLAAISLGVAIAVSSFAIIA
jgi:undecaprenyl-diphosphatase